MRESTEEKTPLMPRRQGALRSHMMMDVNDPSVTDSLSVQRLRRSMHASASVPSAVHGAPQDAQESRETLERLKRMGGFEAQDFDPADNDIERDYALNRSEQDYATAESWRWILSIIIGMVMGALAFLVDWGIEVMNSHKYNMIRDAIAATAPTGGGGSLWPYALDLAISLGYAFIAGGIVSFIEPLAAGSGIAEIKTYLNGVHIKGLLTLRTLMAKLTGVTFSIAAGLVAGKEGPFVHGGGIVGGGVGGMGSLSITEWSGWRFVAKTPRQWGGHFRNAADHRDFTAIGTAAGVATAFAAPIGGLLFCIEEGVSFYSTSIFWRGFLASAVGVLTLHIMVDVKDHPGSLVATKFGRFRDFGLYPDNLASYGSRMYYRVWDIPVFCCMGALGGLLGAAFIAANIRVTQLRHRHAIFRSPWRRLTEVLVLASVTSTLWFAAAYASPCNPLPSQDDLAFIEATDKFGDVGEFLGGGGEGEAGLEHFPRLWCPPGKYSAWGQLFMAPLSQALRLIMHLGEPLPESRPQFEFSAAGLFLFFLFTLTIMCWTNGVGASTGMFVPSLAVGAAGGRLIGRLMQAIIHSFGGGYAVSLTAYSVVGAAAVLGGATRLTLTATVMVMETTGALQLIVPLMLAVFFAKVVGDKFGVGIDDTHIRLRGAPVLDEAGVDLHQQMIDDKLSVSELMTTSLITLPPVVRVDQLVQTLRMCSHQAFPVTPDTEKALAGNGEPFQLHGVILRSTVLHMLRARIGWIAAGSPAPAPATGATLTSPGSGAGWGDSYNTNSSRGNGSTIISGGGGGSGTGFNMNRPPRPGKTTLSGSGGNVGGRNVRPPEGSEWDGPKTQKERLKVLERMQQIPLKVRVREEQERILYDLSPSDLSGWMDLRPFMQRAPYVVPETSSLTRGYRLFRTMGLRHMFVGPSYPQVTGLITRKDIITDNAKLALGRKANLGLGQFDDKSRGDSGGSPVLPVDRRRALPFIPYSAYDPTAGGSFSQQKSLSPGVVGLAAGQVGRPVLGSIDLEGGGGGGGDGSTRSEAAAVEVGDRAPGAAVQRRRGTLGSTIHSLNTNNPAGSNNTSTGNLLGEGSTATEGSTGGGMGGIGNGSGGFLGRNESGRLRGVGVLELSQGR